MAVASGGSWAARVLLLSRIGSLYYQIIVLSGWVRVFVWGVVALRGGFRAVDVGGGLR